MARERIAKRMGDYSAYDDTAVFSLLALCHTPKEKGKGGDGDGGVDASASAPAPDPAVGGAGDDDGAGDDGGIRRAAARKGDYTPAVHSWLKKLADKGVLRQLATGEPDEGVGEGDELG